MELTQSAAGKWRLETYGEQIGYDGEHMAREIKIQTQTSGEWTYYADFEYADGTKATLPLIYHDGMLTANVERQYLKPGAAQMQIRAAVGQTVKKSNKDGVMIDDSINATEELDPLPEDEWDVYARQVAQMRDDAQQAAGRAEEAAGRGPYIGDDGYWMVWDAQTGEYVSTGVVAGGTGGGGGVDFTTDDTLVLENGILRVNTINRVEEDNTLPITSAAVYAEVGNINALLATI